MAYQRPPAWVYAHPELMVGEFVDRVMEAGWSWRGGPVTVISWYRGPDRNRAAGGDRFSQHLIATGADFQTTSRRDGFDLEDHFRRHRLIAVPTGTSGMAVHAQLHAAGFLRRLLRA